MLSRDSRNSLRGMKKAAVNILFWLRHYSPVITLVLFLWLSVYSYPRRSNFSLRYPVTLSQRVAPSPRLRISPSPDSEYLWYEAENMRGFAIQSNGEPVLNPSWLNSPKAKTPGW